MAGLYIHIPFCKSRCIYCGFYSTTRHELHDRYISCVCREMELRKDDLPAGHSVSTIYVGGGTPSCLSPQNLSKLFLYINKVYGVGQADSDGKACREVTIECNPDDISREFVSTLRTLPVNRVSLGVQTFSDIRLQFLRRRHSASQAKEAVEMLRAGGFHNISIDLMFGFPGQSLADWQEDIAQAIALKPEHVSAYSLTYEEGTALMQMKRAKLKINPLTLKKQYDTNGGITIEETDEELSRQMYELLLNRLAAAGFEHYEISNFAKPGYRSRHNSSYWQDVPYIGLGAAAHSYDRQTRSWNPDDISQYMEAIERGHLPAEREIIDDDTRYNDLVATALRTKEGLPLSSLAPKHRKYLLRNAQRSIDAGTLTTRYYPDGAHLCLTHDGLFVSDDIMSDLVYV